MKKLSFARDERQRLVIRPRIFSTWFSVTTGLRYHLFVPKNPVSCKLWPSIYRWLHAVSLRDKLDALHSNLQNPNAFSIFKLNLFLLNKVDNVFTFLIEYDEISILTTRAISRALSVEVFWMTSYFFLTALQRALKWKKVTKCH